MSGFYVRRYGFRGFGDDGGDSLILTGTNTTDMMTTPTDVTAPASAAYQQAQASLAAMFSFGGGASSPGVSSGGGYTMQDLQDYLNGTARPEVVNFFTSLPTSTMDRLQNLALGLPPSANIIGGPGSSGLPNSNLMSQLAQQWTNITGKILQQTTLPAGQIQITGPNGQSEIIQTSASTAGIGLPGLMNNSNSLIQFVMLCGIGLVAVKVIEGAGH